MPESGFRHAGDNPKSGSRPPIAVEIAVTDEPKCSMIRRFEQLVSRDNLDEKGRRQSEFESGGR
jgi:hypothetical protein